MRWGFGSKAGRASERGDDGLYPDLPLARGRPVFQFPVRIQHTIDEVVDVFRVANFQFLSGFNISRNLTRITYAGTFQFLFGFNF